MDREASRKLLKLKKNIFLTGFMGAGKSSVGKGLAGLLSMEFYDLDVLISSSLGMSISEIFSNYGEDYFRRRETAVLAGLGDKTPGSCVVATGGGAVLQSGNIKAMQKNGIVIYLHVTAAEAYDRVKEARDRPLLQVENPLQQIHALLQQREPCYRLADFSIHTTGKTVRQITEEIINILKESEFWTVSWMEGQM